MADVMRDPRVLLAACLLHPLPVALATAIKEVLATATPQQAEPLTPEWIWSWLMDWCKQNGTSPANYDSLFKMVSDARAALAAREAK